jgi:hypothetical protein
MMNRRDEDEEKSKQAIGRSSASVRQPLPSRALQASFSRSSPLKCASRAMLLSRGAKKRADGRGRDRKKCFFGATTSRWSSSLPHRAVFFLSLRSSKSTRTFLMPRHRLAGPNAPSDAGYYYRVKGYYRIKGLRGGASSSWRKMIVFSSSSRLLFVVREFGEQVWSGKKENKIRRNAEAPVISRRRGLSAPNCHPKAPGTIKVPE